MFPEQRQYAFPLVHHLGWGLGVEAGTALSALTSLGEVAWGEFQSRAAWPEKSSAGSWMQGLTDPDNREKESAIYLVPSPSGSQQASPELGDLRCPFASALRSVRIIPTIWLPVLMP